jgi:hypothetical protein
MAVKENKSCEKAAYGKYEMVKISRSYRSNRQSIASKQHRGGEINVGDTKSNNRKLSENHRQQSCEMWRNEKRRRQSAKKAGEESRHLAAKMAAANVSKMSEIMWRSESRSIS